MENTENIESDKKVDKEEKEINEIKEIKEIKIGIQDRVKSIAKSLSMNYKSWLLIILAVSILSYPNVILGYTTFLILIISAYFFHYSCHFKAAYPLNIVHLYHHNHNNNFSHFIQIMLELVLLIFFLYLKERFHFSFLNVWIILFFYIFYTTIHNINYSIYHVNTVHEMHHKLKVQNMGPDICDIIFNTKYNVDHDVENTDHYNYNILVSFTVAMALKLLWTKLNDNQRITYISLVKNTFYIVMLILFVTSVYLFFEGTTKNDVEQCIK